MSARAWNVSLGIAFAALGSALAVAGWRLPEGLAGVPGPGAFPLVVGLLTTALGAALAAFPHDDRRLYWQHGLSDPPVRRTLAILVLLGVYVAVWDTIPFIVRTPLLLVAIYRVAGEPWLRSTAVGLAVTVVLWAAFQLLLRVRL